MGVLIVIHRYLGVAVGLLMTLWCLSGFVMMYQSFPGLEAGERLAGLAPLALAGCCDPDRIALPDAAEVSGFRIEMAAGEPVLRLAPTEGSAQVFSLRTGAPKSGFSDTELLAVARTYGAGHGLGEPRALGVIDKDQWSVQLAARNRPVHLFAFDGGAEVYVSGKTGQVFLDTDRRERTLSWFGAIPHWLYPTLLRQNGKLWSQVVIWSATIGTFLTLTGLYVGVMRLRRLPNGRWSPFRGLWFWHHMTGLIFGLLTLSWVVSGLLSMNPWGLLEGAGGSVGRDVTGTTRWGEVKALVAAAPAMAAGGAVQLSMATLGGQPYVLAVQPDGKTARFAAEAKPAPLQRQAVAEALAAAKAPVASLDLIDREDAYYYGHHGEVALPAYRAILADAQKTRVYIDAGTGRVERVIDSDGRAYRWLQSGMHDFDLPGLRRRPIWDLVVLPLLAGVTLLCGIGSWLAIRRVRRDFAGLRLRARRA